MKQYKKEKQEDPRQNTGKKSRYQENPEVQLVYKASRYHKNPRKKQHSVAKKEVPKKPCITIEYNKRTYHKILQ